MSVVIIIIIIMMIIVIKMYIIIIILNFMTVIVSSYNRHALKVIQITICWGLRYTASALIVNVNCLSNQQHHTINNIDSIH